MLRRIQRIWIILGGAMLLAGLSVDYSMAALPVGANAGGAMAGYVLNAETNMNQVYSRQLNRQLMPGNSQPRLEEPLIQYESLPPNYQLWNQPQFLLRAPKPAGTPHP